MKPVFIVVHSNDENARIAIRADSIEAIRELPENDVDAPGTMICTHGDCLFCIEEYDDVMNRMQFALEVMG